MTDSVTVEQDDRFDECECGDWRMNHKDGTGACCFNSSEFDLTHGGRDCHKFRQAIREPKP